MTRNGTNRIVVITGASSGIGRATSLAFASRGWAVGLIARGLDGLEGARRDVEEEGGAALVLPALLFIFAVRKYLFAMWGIANR